ncbi:MAG TPA: hypothetical protein VL307_10305 [Chitinophagaceae bacterium]|nr:hypothetical protein [Chitinophagaceae bacterium]
MEQFSIEYHNQVIRISPIEGESTDRYKLTYQDDRWLIIDKKPEESKTVATFNASVSYSTATVWAIEQKSEGPDWVNTEQLQVIGEIITRKAQELQHTAEPATH